MLFPKKYICFSLLSLFALTALQAQMGSKMGMGPKKPGIGGQNSNKGSGGAFHSSFGKKGMSSGMGSHSSGSSGSSKKGNGSTYSSNYSKSKSSTKSQYSTNGSGGSGSTYSTNHSSSSLSGSSGGSSAKAMQAGQKGTPTGHSYPGIGKSKASNSLKGGTRYSYPGVHGAKGAIASKKKKTPGSNTASSSKK